FSVACVVSEGMQRLTRQLVRIRQNACRSSRSGRTCVERGPRARQNLGSKLSCVSGSSSQSRSIWRSFRELVPLDGSAAASTKIEQNRATSALEKLHAAFAGLSEGQRRVPKRILRGLHSAPPDQGRVTAAARSNVFALDGNLE